MAPSTALSRRPSGSAAPTSRTIQSQRPRSADLLEQMGATLYRSAYEQGMSLSAFLEQEDPSTLDEKKEGMDAFSRLVAAADIRVQSLPEHGVYADAFEAFDKSEQTRALVPEFFHRAWRRVAMGHTSRAVYATPDMPTGGALNPYSDVQRPARPPIAPAIPLDRLVAATTPIDTDAYRAFYLVADDPDNYRMVRVGEGAEVPRAKLVAGESTIRLHKFGRALEATYETLRRQSIDRIRFHIERLAAQAEVDKVVALIDVLVNGDGNPGTAAEVFNQTTLHPGSATGMLTLQSWLAFKLKFNAPYTLTTALVQEAVALGMLMLSTGTANTPLVAIANQAGFGTFTPINPTLSQGVGLGWLADAPSNKVVGFDDRMAVERVIEIGSNIQEVDRYINRQTQILVMTEVEGFVVVDQDAAKVLNLAA